LLAFPPVVRGQAAAGVDPGLALAVGTAVADAPARTGAAGDAETLTVGLAVREADADGVAVGDEAASG